MAAAPAKTMTQTSEGTILAGEPAGVAQRLRGRAGSGTAACLVLLTGAAAALRFWRIGHQSYWEDEAVTVRLLHQSLGHMLAHGIPQLETTPPLYYVLAWIWARVFGSGETALRSLSALLGIALVPVAFEIGRTLASRRAGLATAALAAFSPPLVWYSQEARAYALLVLTCGLSLLYCLRLWRQPSRRDVVGWGVSSALALASQYFAAIPIAVEAALLLALPRTRRRVAPAIAAVVAVGLVLVPLALHQKANGRTAWIAASSLGGRLRATATEFLSGRYPLAHATWLAAAAAVASLALLVAADRRTRRGGLLALGLGVAFLTPALLLALAGADYFLYRNLLPAWLPLAAAAAVALAGIRQRALGAAAIAAVCALGLLAVLDVARRPDLQRDDWRAAARTLGPAPAGRRVILISPPLTRYALELYRPEARPLASTGARVRSLELLSVGAGAGFHAPAGFTRTGSEQVQHLTLVHYRAARPRLVSPRVLGLPAQTGAPDSSAGFSADWQPRG